MIERLRQIFIEILETFLKYLRSTAPLPKLEEPVKEPEILKELPALDPPASEEPIAIKPVSKGTLPKKFDEIFLREGKEIPVEYLRALSYSESRMNPKYELEKGIDLDLKSYPDGKKDSYWGLFQVGISNVLKDYNTRHKTSITPEQLFDPEINTKLAVDTLMRIMVSYESWGKQHGIQSLTPDWNNVEFVKLVTAGWNSGYSRSSGVQSVAKWLQENVLEVTHDNVFKYAGQVPKATKYLDGKQFEKKRDWHRKVVERYFKERGVDLLV
jgi:hypothetical protein